MINPRNTESRSIPHKAQFANTARDGMANEEGGDRPTGNVSDSEWGNGPRCVVFSDQEERRYERHQRRKHCLPVLGCSLH